MFGIGSWSLQKSKQSKQRLIVGVLGSDHQPSLAGPSGFLTPQEGKVGGGPRGAQVLVSTPSSVIFRDSSRS